ncbi:hypothetical protein LshimejAT787_1801540 [Lyophyllum shimeji]|uniref:Uncharacterized protein n=1 Tax=Lyophyllum shimeji TaxID=47721 RepID=A0A9P3UU47_LYOSH|nr:hypothetical protein LshimejAT787_1801540 [Lyophyllum shimeji]
MGASVSITTRTAYGQGRTKILHSLHLLHELRGWHPEAPPLPNHTITISTGNTTQSEYSRFARAPGLLVNVGQPAPKFQRQPYCDMLPLQILAALVPSITIPRRERLTNVVEYRNHDAATYVQIIAIVSMFAASCASLLDALGYIHLAVFFTLA